MQFSAVATLGKRKKADLLLLPYWEGVKAACDIGELAECVEPLTASGDFKGKEGEIAYLYVSEEIEPRIAMVGLGKQSECQIDTLRRAYVAAVKLARTKEWGSLNVALPSVKGIEDDLVVRGVVEGLLLNNYTFDQLKHDVVKEKPSFLVLKVGLIGASAKQLAMAKRLASLFIGVTKARDLVNGNADTVTPQYLADLARELAGQYKSIETTVFDRKRIEKEGMGLFLAVNKGSPRDPAFIIMRYTGALQSKEHTILIGKGVTYDTGGLNLKPTGHMETMKSDMSGAAAVFGAILAAAEMEMKVNFTVVVAATENCIGGGAYKPGDVFTSYTGRTVEIVNTDAEGRLTLADALAYCAAKLKPTRMINLATLTGACVVALGEEIAGLMSNNDRLAESIEQASERSGEAVWRLPLPKSYQKQLKSDIADMKNCGSRAGGSITAGLFLQDFVGDHPWAHLDIAGTAYHEKPISYDRLNATGYGVRLLIELLEG